jgi:hypothetical protein
MILLGAKKMERLILYTEKLAFQLIQKHAIADENVAKAAAARKEAERVQKDAEAFFKASGAVDAKVFVFAIYGLMIY